MHWYGGSIAEAVTLSKQRNAIFVVFVEGDNDLSTEMATMIDDTVIVSRLSDPKNFLAVKLKSGTPNYTHFAQIYQFVPVPSLFFIGRNGTPLEVVCAGVETENLASRIDRILAEHRKEKPAMQPSTSSQTIKEDTANLLRAEAKSDAPKEVPATKEVPTVKEVLKKDDVPIQEVKEDAPSPPKISKPTVEHEVVCDGDVCVRRPKADQPSTSQTVTPVTPPPTPADEVKKLPEPAISSASIEDKMDRAKELIEARRREKADQDEQLEKQKELERRSTGQGVAELKKWQADQELKAIQEERKREKLENNLARQRILAQIAQDRAERRARDVAPAPAAPPPAPAPAQPTAPMTTGDASVSSRVQFKLPDGSSHTAHFPADDTLQQLQRYVADNLHLPSSSFSLWTAFPRRELVEADSTLRELQLAPSAALLVLPRREPPQTPRQPPFASIYAFLTRLLTSLIYEPSLQLYTWLSSRLFPPPAVGGRPRGGAPPRGAPLGGAGAAGVRHRRTNIHRLPGDAPDDDNNTWNGNSTQQM